MHRLIDVTPVSIHIGDRGPAQEPPVLPAVTVAKRDVVGVEQISKIRIKSLIPFRVGRKEKRLKKPTGVCKMPFGRADIGHGLDNKIFSLKRLAKLHRKLPHFVETATQFAALSIRGFAKYRGGSRRHKVSGISLWAIHTVLRNGKTRDFRCFEPSKNNVYSLIASNLTSRSPFSA
jgi:hypothetical protein